jgi:hypothetical protein
MTSTPMISTLRRCARRRRVRFGVAALALAIALGGCVASDGSPGSPGVPMMGQSRVSAAELAQWYRANAPASLPYRVSNIGLDQLAELYVSEGNRYNVRGDVAFAQSVVETAWFHFPDYGQVRPWNNNFSGIGACDSCGGGFQFSSPLAGVRAQIQLLRNYADFSSQVTTIPDPPVAELWGSNPATAAYNFNNYFAKGRAPLWNNMGNGNWATAPNYATVVLRVYNQILTYSGQPGQCPFDGLTFGALTDMGPCPVDLRQPGRALAPTPSGGYYVLNGSGAVFAYNGATHYGGVDYGSDMARDIAVMPDGDGYVVLSGIGTVHKFGSAAQADTLGPVGMLFTWGNDLARSIAIMPDAKGYVILLSDGTVAKFGSATTGAIAALPSPALPDSARSIQVMPDGAGYFVLDGFGTVHKFGSATTGLVGSASTPHFDLDIARDVLVFNGFGSPFGYYVLDAWGGVWNSAALPPVRNPAAQLFADRWRAGAIIGGRPFLLKNDGATVTAVP